MTILQQIKSQGGKSMTLAQRIDSTARNYASDFFDGIDFDMTAMAEFVAHQIDRDDLLDEEGGVL
jgi:hypothetical protein